MDLLLGDQRIKASKIEYLERELERMKQRNSLQEPKVDSPTGNEITRVRRPVSSIETTMLINEIRARVPSYLVENDLTSKHANLTLEVKQMKHIVTGTEDKCDALEKIVLEARKTGAETRQELSDLETHLKYQNKLMGINNFKGHLIWRIDSFSTKLKNAKENDIVLKSPVFCNRQYGYTLRVSVFIFL